MTIEMCGTFGPIRKSNFCGVTRFYMVIGIGADLMRPTFIYISESESEFQSPSLLSPPPENILIATFHTLCGMWDVDTPYDHIHIFSIQHTTKTLQTLSHAAS